MKELTTQIAIVGGGPSGLATADRLQRAGRDVLVIEKGPVANHINRFPANMTFFSTRDLVEIGGFPLTIPRDKPTKQEYLAYLRRFVKDREIRVLPYHEASGLEGEKGNFTLNGTAQGSEPFRVHAEQVILATGAFATPQPLNVPGESLPKVSHYFDDVHSYFGSKVLVVGGRNSAVEAALDLWRSGVEVSICHRRATFNSVKYWIEPDIENRIKEGSIRVYRPAQIVEIKPHAVVIQRQGRDAEEIENDFVLALTGYRPDPALLGRFGIAADPTTGGPPHDPETLESERPGLYIVGVMLAGNISSAIFIENSRFHAEKILTHLNNGGGTHA